MASKICAEKSPIAKRTSYYSNSRTVSWANQETEVRSFCTTDTYNYASFSLIISTHVFFLFVSLFKMLLVTTVAWGIHIAPYMKYV